MRDPWDRLCPLRFPHIVSVRTRGPLSLLRMAPTHGNPRAQPTDACRKTLCLIQQYTLENMKHLLQHMFEIAEIFRTYT
jgi:hypothetical protein